MTVGRTGDVGTGAMRSLPPSQDDDLVFSDVQYYICPSRSLYTILWRKQAGAPKKEPAARKSREPIASRVSDREKTANPLFLALDLREKGAGTLFSAQTLWKKSRTY